MFSIYRLINHGNGIIRITDHTLAPLIEGQFLTTQDVDPVRSPSAWKSPAGLI